MNWIYPTFQTYPSRSNSHWSVDLHDHVHHLNTSPFSRTSWTPQQARRNNACQPKCLICKTIIVFYYFRSQYFFSLQIVKNIVKIVMYLIFTNFLSLDFFPCLLFLEIVDYDTQHATVIYIVFTFHSIWLLQQEIYCPSFLTSSRLIKQEAS